MSVSVLFLEDHPWTIDNELRVVDAKGLDAEVCRRPLQVANFLHDAASRGANVDLLVLDINIPSVRDLSEIGIPNSGTASGEAAGLAFAESFLRAEESKYRAIPIAFLTAFPPPDSFMRRVDKLRAQGANVAIFRKQGNSDEFRSFLESAMRGKRASDQEDISDPVSLSDQIEQEENLSGLILRPVAKIIPATAELVKALQKDPSQLTSLTAEQFELLICDRLDDMGFDIHKVGHAFRPDGGVDIVARYRNQPFPALLAVQAKHSRSGYPVDSTPVKNLQTVIQSAPFDAGLIVTNTNFTVDAHWWALHGPRLIRLRSLEDVTRWIQRNFLADCQLTEFPSEIQLGKVRIPIPK